MKRLDWWLGFLAALLVANLAVSVAIYRHLSRWSPPPAASLAEPETLPEVMPWVLHRVTPEYPAEAREQGWQGQVILRITVDTLGRVAEVQVARSSGYAVLDSSAVAAARQWRFEPAREGDRPVSATLLLPFQFRLAEGP